MKTGDSLTDSATIIFTIEVPTREPHQIGFIATNLMIVLLYDGPSLMVSQSKWLWLHLSVCVVFKITWSVKTELI